jgi:membrane protein implicated in regulation of membrane protease activity
MHPLVPQDIPVYGYLYDVRSGRPMEVAKATEVGRPVAGKAARSVARCASGCRPAPDCGTPFAAMAAKSAKSGRAGRGRPTGRVALRYVLFQIPGWALVATLAFGLREPFGAAPWLAWAIVLVWIGKDALLFPFVWYAYVPDTPHAEHSLIGARGVVAERLAPAGYVRLGGELWRAEILDAGASLEPGTAVRVGGIRGLTLLVHAARDDRGLAS